MLPNAVGRRVLGLNGLSDASLFGLMMDQEALGVIRGDQNRGVRKGGEFPGLGALLVSVSLGASYGGHDQASGGPRY